MFKSRNLHLRNHHNKHLKHAYTLTECGVEHNKSRKWQNKWLILFFQLSTFLLLCILLLSDIMSNLLDI